VFHSPTHLKHIVFSSALLALAITGAGCGKKGFGGLVSQAQFEAVEENGELYGDLRVLLNTGNVLLPSFDLPILNPRVPASEYGAISLHDALGLGTELGIRVNLNAIAGVDSVDGALLPNGKMIPVVLPGGAKPVSIQVKGSTRVYLAIGQGSALIGTAIVIPEFDRLAGYIGGLDVFFPFQGQNGVRGAAGLFSSVVPGQSGLAVFVDVSSVLKGASQKSLVAAAAKASAQAEPLVLNAQQSLSSSQTARLNQFVRGLGSRGKRLGLQ